MTVREYLLKKEYSWEEKQRPSGLNAIMNCPFHDDHEKKFAINLETGAFQCFAKNKCGVTGGWKDFQRLLGDIPVPLINTGNIKIQEKKHSWQKPQVHSVKLGTEVFRYFESQGITQKTVKDFRIGETPDGKTVIYPYFKDGELVGVKYRTIRQKKMWSEKNQEPVLFNRDRIKPTDDTLIITEGEKDCMTLSQLGMENIVSVPNGVSDLRWIENEWNWLDRFKKIYLVMDNDKAGREAVDKIAMRLGRWRCYNVILPVKDPNEYLKDKKDEAGHIIDYFDRAKSFDPAGLTRSGEYAEDLIGFRKHKERTLGIPTLFHGLTELLQGWRYNELTVWTGQNGSGKSTMLNQLIIDLAKRGERSCLTSLEMRPLQTLNWIHIQLAGIGGLTDEKIREQSKWLNEYLWLTKNYGEIVIDELLDIYEYATRKYGIKHFIIDSLMLLKLPFSDELKGQKAVARKLVTFAEQYNTHVHLVAHPRKGARDNEDVFKVDVSGTADITNLAHNVISLVRVPEEKKAKINCDTILTLRKNREWGKEGHIKLTFDSDTKTFKEII